MVQQVTPTSSPLLTERDVAVRLNISIPTLRRWRMLRTGPAFCKLNGGGAVRYHEGDVAEFLRSARKN